MSRPGTYLLSVVPAHGLWVDANFKEDQLAADGARPAGDGGRRCAAGHALPWPCAEPRAGTGAVFSVIPPENATGNFTKIVQRVPVRIALDDGDAHAGPLRPGLSITVERRHARQDDAR